MHYHHVAQSKSRQELDSDVIGGREEEGVKRACPSFLEYWILGWRCSSVGNAKYHRALVKSSLLHKPGMVAHTYGLSNHTVQTGGLEVQDQPEIQSCPFHIYTYIPTPMHTHTHTHTHPHTHAYIPS